MTAGEMLSWQNRLEEVRKIKESHLQRDRMRSLKIDFVEAYREKINGQSDKFVTRLYLTIDREHFMIV